MVKLFLFTVLLLPCISITTALEMSDSKVNTKFAQNSALFSVDFYNKLSASNKGQNIIFSPFSIQTCVALAYAGATGKTAEEIANGLKLVANDRSLVAESFQSVLANYQNSTLLKIANKIYVKQGYEINPEFNQIAKESFFSTAEDIDFEQSVAAANTINKWVEEKTNNKIKDLISPDVLDAMTRLVLVNAIHFKGEWVHKFEKDDTQEEDFFVNETDSIKVEMMNGKANYLYGAFEDLQCTALEMAYRDSDLSMLILLPNSRTGLNELEQKLQGVNLLGLTQRMSKQEVVVKFPKFKVEFSAELTPPLKQLGIERMFSNSAEFGNLLVSPEPLLVSKVIHKAFIEVNEEGAEAAAATALRVLKKRSIRITNELIADHPFIFALVAGRSTERSILFYGAYVHPESLAKKAHDEL